MQLIHYIGLFFGGLFFMNAIPHLVSAVLGRAFQTPFAKPPGEGLSSSTTNAVWGLGNLVVAYVLLVPVSAGKVSAPIDVAAAGLGVAVITLFSARHFGRFHGGNSSSAE